MKIVNRHIRKPKKELSVDEIVLRCDMISEEMRLGHLTAEQARGMVLTYKTNLEVKNLAKLPRQVNDLERAVGIKDDLMAHFGNGIDEGDEEGEVVG